MRRHRLPLSALCAAVLCGAAHAQDPSSCPTLGEAQCGTGVFLGVCQWDANANTCAVDVCIGKTKAECIVVPTVAVGGEARTQCKFNTQENRCESQLWRLRGCNEGATNEMECAESAFGPFCVWDGASCAVPGDVAAHCAGALTAARTRPSGTEREYLMHACAGSALGVCDFYPGATAAGDRCLPAYCGLHASSATCGGACTWDATANSCDESANCALKGAFTCAQKSDCGLQQTACVMCAPLASAAECDAVYGCMYKNGMCTGALGEDGCKALGSDGAACAAAGECFMMEPLNTCEAVKEASACDDLEAAACASATACTLTGQQCLPSQALCSAIPVGECRLRADCTVQGNQQACVAVAGPLVCLSDHVKDDPAKCNAMPQCMYVPRNAEFMELNGGSCVSSEFFDGACGARGAKPTCEADASCAWHAGHGICTPRICSALDATTCAAVPECVLTMGLCHPVTVGAASATCQIVDYTKACDGGACTGLNSKFTGQTRTLVPSYTPEGQPFLPPFVGYLVALMPTGGLQCTLAEQMSGACELCAPGYVQNAAATLSCVGGRMNAGGQVCVLPGTVGATPPTPAPPTPAPPTPAPPGVPPRPTSTPAPPTPAPAVSTVGKVLLMHLRTTTALFNKPAFLAAMRTVVSAAVVKSVNVLYVCPASVCPNAVCPTAAQVKISNGCRAGASYASVSRAFAALQQELEVYTEFDVVPADNVDQNTARDHAYSELLKDLQVPSGSKMAASGMLPAGIYTQNPTVGGEPATPMPEVADDDDDYKTAFIVALICAIVILVACIAIIMYCKGQGGSQGDAKDVDEPREAPTEPTRSAAPSQPVPQSQPAPSQPPRASHPAPQSYPAHSQPVHSNHAPTPVELQPVHSLSDAGMPRPLPVPVPAGGHVWQTGDIVEVLFDDKWHPAQVVEVQHDRNLTVNWEDGTHSRDVHPAFTRYPQMEHM
eukprot:TRINITY_DN3283_c0_g1_i1.p1 TRINITY_DN3283_c0_g1~~TRINITY_DN3283_c0_g1_i1.p1  ORF type:complete len:952 (+),score=255.39 TRINITY_DN3283_c0_g1_i1:40-2895(+)